MIFFCWWKSYKKGDGTSYNDCNSPGNRGQEKGKRWAGRRAGGQGAQSWGCVWILNRGSPISAGHQNELLQFYSFLFIDISESWAKACSECAYARSNRSHKSAKLQRAKRSALLSGYVFVELTPTVFALDLFQGVFAGCSA